MKPKLNRILKGLKLEKAMDILAGGPSSVSEILYNVESKAFQSSARLKGVRADLTLALRMIKQTVKGEYKGLSNDSLVIFIAAFLYFLNPMDLIPDFLIPIGLTDDLGLLVWVFAKFRGELESYRKWHDSNSDQFGN